MTPEVQIIREKKLFSKIITGSASVRPEFHGFKDLPAMESLLLGGRPATVPSLGVEVKAEMGMFSTKYFVFANLIGTAPMASGRKGMISGYADVSPLSVRYFTPDGESAGVNARKKLHLEKTSGIASGVYDDYSLGIEGNLDAVIKLVSSMPLFKDTVLNVIKAVAKETGDLTSSGG